MLLKEFPVSKKDKDFDLACDDKGLKQAVMLPKCFCGKPVARLVNLFLTENGHIVLEGTCEDECELIIPTVWSVLDVLRNIKRADKSLLRANIPARVN